MCSRSQGGNGSGSTIEQSGSDARRPVPGPGDKSSSIVPGSPYTQRIVRGAAFQSSLVYRHRRHRRTTVPSAFAAALVNADLALPRSTRSKQHGRTGFLLRSAARATVRRAWWTLVERNERGTPQLDLVGSMTSRRGRVAMRLGLRATALTEFAAATIVRDLCFLDGRRTAAHPTRLT